MSIACLNSTWVTNGVSARVDLIKWQKMRRRFKFKGVNSSLVLRHLVLAREALSAHSTRERLHLAMSRLLVRRQIALGGETGATFVAFERLDARVHHLVAPEDIRVAKRLVTH